MKTLHFAIATAAFCLLPWSQTQAQSNWSEILKRSAFAKDDLSKVASGQVQGKRSPFDITGVMSVQNCFLVPSSPEKVAATLLSWNPTSYGELGIVLHEKIDRPPTAQNLSRLALDPRQSFMASLLSKSAGANPNNSLNLSKAEAAQLQSANQGPNTLSLAWREILLNRAANYQASGITNYPPYENKNGRISLSAEVQKLVRQIPGITQNFAPVLAVALNNPNSPKQAESFYWELLKVQREATFLLGAVYQVNDPSGKIQVADFQYYVSGSFAASLILYELTPVVNQGRPSTLVWRSDFVFIPSSITGSGMERMATENILLLEVQKSIARFQKDAS